MLKDKVVMILSGGLDSTVLLYDLLQEYDVTALSFDYGQRHWKEIDYAADTAEKLDVNHYVIQIKGMLLSSALTNRTIEVPHGHYTDESMKLTVVPNRNAIMLSVAYGHAVSFGAKMVAFGAHAGDHAIYPDCRLQFIKGLEAAFQLGNASGVKIHAPYIDKTKADIVRLGDALGVPWNQTWSCYEGNAHHCGLCGTCVERREAFKLAGVLDHTFYTGDTDAVTV